jgi:hypothetical protein
MKSTLPLLTNVRLRSAVSGLFIAPNWIKAFFLIAGLFIADQVVAQPWMSSVENNPRPNFFTIQKDFNQYWLGKTVEKGKGYKAFKRWEWYWQTRINPDGTFPDAVEYSKP